MLSSAFERLQSREWRLSRLFFLVVVLSVGLGASPSHAQERTLTVHSASQFWILGEATTHDFTCRVNRVEGTATLPPNRAALSSSDGQSSREEGRQPEVIVRVPVQAFDCGRRRMTEDLQETLKMEAHPEIRFELVDASVGAPTDTSGRWRAIRVLGTLTIAGTKRLVNLEARGHALDDNRFRVRGCRAIRMTDFNIEPPTKAFGIIKVKDRVEVQFDLFAHATAVDSPVSFEKRSTNQALSCTEN
jgi:polyisoprenoid-binding protein YceI